MAKISRRQPAKTARKTKVRTTSESNPQLDFEAQLEHQANRVKFGKLVPRNPAQAELLRLLGSNRIVLAHGDAGTGKSFLMTSYAAEALLNDEIDQIIITRPQVDCDEEMGFLPGDEAEKFASWLGPFMDVLEGKLGKGRVASFMKFGQIQARPLGKMRGSTFRRAIVILDEAQNTTRGQMKMFLTRLGEGSKAFVNGDLEQSDLPNHVINGLAEVTEVLANTNGVAVHHFKESDVVRDPLVKEVLKAYKLYRKV